MPALASAASGDRDPSFGAAGVANVSLPVLGLGTVRRANALAIQPLDGKIVVVGGAFDSGGASQIELVRFGTNGVLDSDFGTAGIVTTPTTERSLGTAVAIQGGGEIVVGTDANSNASGSVLLARYADDGSLDVGFGTGGIVPPGTYPWPATYSLQILPGEQILAAGHLPGDSGSPYVVSQFDADGALDPALGGDGTVVGTGSIAGLTRNRAVVLSDGKIVIADTRIVPPTPSSAQQSLLGVTRLSSDGSPDVSFGVGGSASVLFKGSLNASAAVAVQGDGKLVVGGAVQARENAHLLKAGMARFNSDGTLDTSFGTDGKVVGKSCGGSNQFLDLAIQADGKIVAASGCGISRFHPDGSLDKDFGKRGLVKLIRRRKGEFGSNALALQTDGKIVAIQFLASGDFRVIRLLQ